VRFALVELLSRDRHARRRRWSISAPCCATSPVPRRRDGRDCLAARPHRAHGTRTSRDALPVPAGAAGPPSRCNPRPTSAGPARRGGPGPRPNHRTAPTSVSCAPSRPRPWPPCRPCRRLLERLLARAPGGNRRTGLDSSSRTRRLITRPTPDSLPWRARWLARSAGRRHCARPQAAGRRSLTTRRAGCRALNRAVRAPGALRWPRLGARLTERAPAVT